MKKKRNHVTYKIWIEIERYDARTDSGEEMDAPGSSVAEFDDYEQAWGYAGRLTHLAESINL